MKWLGAIERGLLLGKARVHHGVRDVWHVPCVRHVCVSSRAHLAEVVAHLIASMLVQQSPHLHWLEVERRRGGEVRRRGEKEMRREGDR